MSEFSGDPVRLDFLRVMILILAPVGATRTQCQQAAVHDDDRVVFYGDSITAQRLYTRFVEDVFLTRYPQMHLQFWNAGVPGDTAFGGYTGDMPARLRRDVFTHQPTVVTIMLGMNDGYYMGFNPKYLDVFRDGYGRLLEGVRGESPAPRVTLISPTPYDEVTHGTEFAHYNDTVSHYSAAVKEMAVASHLGFSDFNQTESNLLNAAMDKNSSLAALLVPDRIHPGEASHWVMACTLARTLGVSPVVSSVRLDAGTKKASSVENAKVADFAKGEDNIQWTQTDDALPLPLPLDDAMIQLVLSISDLGLMDQQLLRVDGLKFARYLLKIDGKEIASFTQDELSTGVNLALYATPMEIQARGVDGIELKRTRLDEVRFLLAVEDPKAASDSDAIRAIQAKDTALAAEQRKAAQPKAHRFELSLE